MRLKYISATHQRLSKTRPVCVQTVFLSVYPSLLYMRHLLQFSFTFAFTFPVERVRDIYSAVSSSILTAQVLLHEAYLQCLLRCGTFSHVCTNHKRLRVDVVA